MEKLQGRELYDNLSRIFLWFTTSISPTSYNI